MYNSQFRCYVDDFALPLRLGNHKRRKPPIDNSLSLSKVIRKHHSKFKNSRQKTWNMTHWGFGFFKISFPCRNGSFVVGLICYDYVIALLYGTSSETPEANVWQHMSHWKWKCVFVTECFTFFRIYSMLHANVPRVQHLVTEEHSASVVEIWLMKVKKIRGAVCCSNMLGKSIVPLRPFIIHKCL